jgi:hypothetical protein
MLQDYKFFIYYFILGTINLRPVKRKVRQMETSLSGSQATVEMVDQSCVALSPELTIEDIRNSEESIQFYTGLQNYESFKALYESLVDFGIDSVKETRGPKAKLRLVRNNK